MSNTSGNSCVTSGIIFEHILNAILEDCYDGMPILSNLLLLKQALNDIREV